MDWESKTTGLLRLFVVCALVMVSASGLLAGDNAQLDIVGFSSDGKYFAFEQHGYYDGSGFGYASMYIIDVAKNAWAEKPIEINGEEFAMNGQEELAEDLDAIRQQLRTKIVPTFRKYGLTSATEGQKILSDFAADGPWTQNDRKQYGFDYNGSKNMLTISEEDAPQDASDMNSGMCPQTLKLELWGSTSKVLQEDEDGLVPHSRGGGYARNYDISGVFVSGNSLVVFVGYHVPSFEGPSKRYIAVSTTL